jgi:hypothetical protein
MFSVACNWKQNTGTEDANLVAVWQPLVHLDPVKGVWSDTYIDTPLGQS